MGHIQVLHSDGDDNDNDNDYYDDNDKQCDDVTMMVTGSHLSCLALHVPLLSLLPRGCFRLGYPCTVSGRLLERKTGQPVWNKKETHHHKIKFHICLAFNQCIRATLQY